jgi:hypothetical protein
MPQRQLRSRPKTTLYFRDQREITLSVSKGDFERVFDPKAAKVTLRRAQADFCSYWKVRS